MSDNNYPKWISGTLPESLGLLEYEIAQVHLKRYEKLSKEIAFGNSSVKCPVAGLKCSAIQDGFDLTDINAKNLEAIIHKYSPSGVVVWATYDVKLGVYQGPYNSTLRDWISSDLIVSPVTIIAVDLDLILCVDEEYSFTIIGAESQIMDELHSFYNDGNMEESFLESAKSYYLAEEQEEFDLVAGFLNKICCWELTFSN